MKKFVKEFRDFIATGNMIELAVAVILGAAIKAVIDKFIEGVANPIVGAIFGKPNLDNVLPFTLRHGDTPEEDSVLRIGLVLTQMISLIPVGLVLFAMVKGYNHMRRPKEEAPAAPAGPTEVELLTEIRDALRSR